MEKIEKVATAEQKNDVFENAQNCLQKEAAQEFASNKVIDKFEPADSKLPDLKLDGSASDADTDLRVINKMTPEQAKSPAVDKNPTIDKLLTKEKYTAPKEPERFKGPLIIPIMPV